MAQRKRTELLAIVDRADMTSIIDVVFLLLVFFMCVTKFKALDYRIDANLPRDKGGPGLPMVMNTAEFRITIDPVAAADDAPRATVRIGRNIYVPLDGLAGAIRSQYADFCSLAANAGMRPPAVIDGHPEVDYEYVVMVIDACTAAGVSRIEFAARPM